mgnify:CR=1 FL=1
MMLPLFLIGVLSVFTQTFLLREVFLVFSGNELSTGLLLSSWMLWIGAGVSFSRRHGNLALYSILYLLFFPIALFFTYSVKTLFHIGSGEIAGVPVILFTSFVILSPLFFILGCIFGRGMKEWEEGESIRGFIRPYMMDSIGDLTGGLLFSYVTLMFIPPSIRPIVSCGLAIWIGILFLKRRIYYLLFILLVPLYFAFGFSFHHGIKRNLPHGKHSKIYDTLYGRYVLLEEKGMVSLYLNGVLSFTYPNRFIDEHVHIPFMFVKKNNPEILSLGLPAPGEAEELVKEGSLTIVQPDKNLPFKSMYPEKVRWVYSDPMRFILRSEQRYDVVFLNTGMPVSLESARFFTRTSAKRISGLITGNGILIVRIPSSENYIEGVIKEIGDVTVSTFRTFFGYHYIIPGETAMVLFSMAPLNPDESRIDGVREKMRVAYLTPYYLRWLIEGERHSYAQERITGSVPSTMQKPVIFYLFTKYWAEKYSPIFYKFLSVFSRIKPYVFFLILLVPLFFKRVGYAVALIGGTGIAIELLSIFQFQMIVGGAYIHIGLLVGIFMLGLGVGSYIFEKIPQNRFNPLLFPLLIPSLLLVLFISKLPPYLVFLLFPGNLYTGMLVGYTYGSATAGMGGKYRNSAALVYTFDLTGAAVGSFLVSMIFIPMYGISPTVYIMVGLCIAGFLRFII